jgi:hypothetical protein
MDVSLDEALRAVDQLRQDFKAENDRLRAQVVGQAAQLARHEARNAAIATGTVNVDFMHCNSCGTRLKDGERCAFHPYEKVNSVGTDAMGKSVLVAQN